MKVTTPDEAIGMNLSAPPNAAVGRATSLPAQLAACVELTKPRITLLVVLSALAGFALAARGGVDYGLLLHTAVGITLLSSGLAALNQYWERDLDALMRRTQTRPLPAGKLSPRAALWCGAVLSVAAEIYLAVLVNPLTALWGGAALGSYVFIYTPLKTRTKWCTFIGAFPGALPVVLGWTAVRNAVGLETLILFAIMFLWQFPHFHAIATLYRDDYARAGIRMLPVLDERATAREIVGYTLALLPVSLLPTFFGLSGWVYFIGAGLLGAAFLYASVTAAREMTKARALRLLKVSVFYLPLLLALLVLGW